MLSLGTVVLKINVKPNSKYESEETEIFSIPLGYSGVCLVPQKHFDVVLDLKMRTFFLHFGYINSCLFFIWAFECFLLKNIPNIFHWETSPFCTVVVFRLFCSVK